MPQILIVTGDAGESYEALYAVHRFREEDWGTTVAAPSVRRLHLVMHDFEPGWDTYVERPGYGLEADVSFDQVNADNYDAILILAAALVSTRNDRAGSRYCPRIRRAAKWIFAICHGIQVLAAGLTKGKRITCYEHVRFEAEQAGGTFVDQQAVRDGRIVTGQTWAISRTPGVLSGDLRLLGVIPSAVKSQRSSNRRLPLLHTCARVTDVQKTTPFLYSTCMEEADFQLTRTGQYAQ